MATTCGFCSGRGWVLGRAYDRFGAAQVPPRICCECGVERLAADIGETVPMPKIAKGT